MKRTSTTRQLMLLASMACLWFPALGQALGKHGPATRADTLRGSIGPYRAWWDALHYDVTVRPDFATRTIQGKVVLTMRAVGNGQRMQIDLQQPLVVDSIKAEIAAAADPTGWGSEHLSFQREGNVVWADFPSPVAEGSTLPVHIYYHGAPRAAKNPPWDGGWIWKRTPGGRPWMSVACQGLGASVWYPCKDHQSDEPDSATLRITVPDTLVGVGNGRLKEVTDNGDGTRTWYWEVTAPINTYNLVPSIGPYVHLHQQYQGAGGPLDLDYWVLQGHERAALEQFQQVPPMLQCFEDWFGPYPFQVDGYKLVEAPHLGMEHQSAIAYGNQYMNGYLGTDLSGTGWGLKWDFVIVHESAHEWFGNSITSADIADMWVHEAFTDYAEALYVECRFGKTAGEDYVIGLRKNIRNDIPIVGAYGVNREGSTDMYYKGANMLHTIRHVMDNDSLFKAMLREMNRRFRHTVVTGALVEQFLCEQSGLDLSKVLDQYLRTTQVPALEWTVRKGKLWVRYANCEEGLAMPVRIMVNGEERMVPVSDRWSSPAYGLKTHRTELQADRNWYVTVKHVPPRTVKLP